MAAGVARDAAGADWFAACENAGNASTPQAASATQSKMQVFRNGKVPSPWAGSHATRGVSRRLDAARAWRRGHRGKQFASRAGCVIIRAAGPVMGIHLMKRRVLFAATTIFAALTPGWAFAHPGLGDAHGFAHGFMHPLGGLDHVAAMVAVGLLAAQLGGRTLWLVPGAFVAAMAAAGVLGALGVGLPYVEVGIALSVLVLGAAVAFEVRLPMALVVAMAGFFAIFHGHAHGTEMPATASGLAYGLGFVLSTALLHAAGIGLGLTLASGRQGRRVVQAAGAAVVVVGAALLSGVV